MEMNVNKTTIIKKSYDFTTDDIEAILREKLEVQSSDNCTIYFDISSGCYLHGVRVEITQTTHE